MIKTFFLNVCVLGLMFSACQKKEKKSTIITDKTGKEIHFYTADSIKVFGDFYELSKDNPTILLFHQGGANARGEYHKIIPKLLNMEHNVLAIDQRIGGQIFGEYNRTIAHIAYQDFSYNGYTYCSAYPDLEGALKYIKKQGFDKQIILWGSSYSATLSIQLANNYQNEIAAVLAFSPASGNPMKECLPDPYFSTLKVPLLLLRPPNEAALENVQKQMEIAKAAGHQIYVAKSGVHGSSMLLSDRVGGDTAQNWDVVINFLEGLK